MQGQSFSKVMVAESFSMTMLKPFFVENGTHHSISYPYMPQQNGHIERKHCHITKIGLAMLFKCPKFILG